MRLAALLFLALLLSTAPVFAGQPEGGGDAAAQFKLGAMYMTGNGAAKDYAEAMKRFRAAADQGYAPAQQNIGWLYYQGLGVTQDYAEAYFWLLLAKKSDPHLLSPYIEKSAQHLSEEQRAGLQRVVQDWKPATATDAEAAGLHQEIDKLSMQIKQTPEDQIPSRGNNLYVQRANLYIKLGNYQAALDDMRKNCSLEKNKDIRELCDMEVTEFTKLHNLQ